MLEIDFNITIVGLGLIGGSYAMAIRDLYPKNLWGIDTDENVINIAMGKGIIDKGYLDPAEALKNSDLVIMCLYPQFVSKFIKDNMNNFKHGAIITDTAGVKNNIINDINSFLRKDLDFIGGHPIAGKEFKGIESASKEIFNDANYVITPIEKNKIENINIVENIAKMIGVKNIIKISPEKHDEIIAYTSQLPHAIAIAIINSNIDKNVENFLGGSFMDATRVANINSELWQELLLTNKKELIKKIEIFEGEINKIKEAILDDDKDFLTTMLNNARYEWKRIQK